MPAAQTETENCVAHNGSMIPVPGRDIMVQAWYQGGLSVFDFTDSANPVEIAFFDRGPIDAKQLVTGGFWSTYWYNGFVYAAEIARGIDILRLTPSEFLSKNEIDAAMSVKTSEFNAQFQPKIAWPNTPALARAYLDQLTRTKALPPPKLDEIKAAVDRAERGRSDKESTAQIQSAAADLQTAAASAPSRDAARMRALATALSSRMTPAR
jgi:hypothetical protein